MSLDWHFQGPPYSDVMPPTSIVEVFHMSVEVEQLGKLRVVGGLYLTNGGCMRLGGLLYGFNSVGKRLDVRLKVGNRSRNCVFNI